MRVRPLDGRGGARPSRPRGKWALRTMQQASSALNARAGSRLLGKTKGRHCYRPRQPPVGCLVEAAAISPIGVAGHPQHASYGLGSQDHLDSISTISSVVCSASGIPVPG